MNGGLKRQLYLLAVGVILAVSLFISLAAVVAMDRLAHQLSAARILSELGWIRLDVNDAHRILKDAGVDTLKSYLDSTQQEIIQKFRDFRIGETGRLYFISDDGRIVSAPSDRQATDLGGPALDLVIRDKVGHAKLMIAGSPSIVYFDTFPEWRWRILLVISEKEINAERDNFILIAILILLLSACAGVIVFARVANSFVLPILELAEKLSRMKDDQLGQQLEVKHRSKEVGILLSAFHSLSDRLFATQKTLQEQNEELQKSKGALRESEELYRALVNTIPHGITVIDREHRIVEINDSHARMYGRPREWFIGRHCYEVFEKRDHICPHCPGVHSMQTGEVAHTETEGVRDDGTRFPVMLHTAPFQLGDRSVGFIEVVEDITEKRELEAIAIKTARLASLGEMATGVAHEINNPITGVINCAQLLKGRLPADSNCQDIVERISREGTRIAKIVKSLLMITHPGHHRVEKVCLRESLETVLTLFQAKLVGSGIQLHIDLPTDLPPIAGEPQMIEQLLLNLINNAHYALNERYPEHHEEKRLTVSVTLKSAPTGGRVCLAVHDQGAGVRTEHLGKLFDPFFTTKPAGVGTGLGLGLCYEIVKLHNGEIRVESEAGRFTRVTVELPVLP